MALPMLKADPGPILPILEQLKDDDDEAVRRSVANNLNDISRDNPDLVLETCERWLGQSANTDRLIKHACRTLLKAGDRRALLLFGYGDPKQIQVSALTLAPRRPRVGQTLRFDFSLQIGGERANRVRVEYAVHFVKARGQLSRKVFQLCEKSFSPGQHQVTKKHAFADLSTRKHYPGEHSLEIIVNGVEMARAAFELIR